VRPGFEIATRLYCEIELTMTRKQVEHVIEETDSGRSRATTITIEAERKTDAGLAGGSVDC
jgi:hypothetical protein